VARVSGTFVFSTLLWEKATAAGSKKAGEKRQICPRFSKVRKQVVWGENSHPLPVADEGWLFEWQRSKLRNERSE